MDLSGAYLAAVAAADPTRLVKQHVRAGALDDWLRDRYQPHPITVIALGKAAPRMIWGLVEANVPFGGIGATVAGIQRPQWDGFTWHVGEHPIPGDGSLAAGQALLDFVESLPDRPVLALLSGGASACAEAPATPDWREAWQADLHAGIPIDEMNRRRASRSHIKGGGLGQRIRAKQDLRVWCIDDTGLGPAAIGSAPFMAAHVDHDVLANGQEAVIAAGQSLATQGLEPFMADRIQAPMEDALIAFLEQAAALGPGKALVAVGEPTLAVPHDAPAGGRNQHAALLAAKWLQEQGSTMTFLAAGTDGIDGTTKEAGAQVTAADWSGAGAQALDGFDASRYLQGLGRTIRTGPSGTNVADLWIAAGQA